MRQGLQNALNKISNKIDNIDNRTSYMIIIACICIVILSISFNVLIYNDTGSMQPVLDQNDIILSYTHVNTNTVDVGDYLIYDSNCVHDTDLIIHKVTSVSGQDIYTQGISARVPDKDIHCRTINNSTIKGKAIYIID